mmetsp:Transcript_6578/g.18353  ORF Transcript_6578/g.18353 Transcript_6578/m.18353 type:complete len:123 (-) Transcript_6578:8-376(-)
MAHGKKNAAYFHCSMDMSQFFSLIMSLLPPGRRKLRWVKNKSDGRHAYFIALVVRVASLTSPLLLQIGYYLQTSAPSDLSPPPARASVHAQNLAGRGKHSLRTQNHPLLGSQCSHDRSGRAI